MFREHSTAPTCKHYRESCNTRRAVAGLQDETAMGLNNRIEE